MELCPFKEGDLVKVIRPTDLLEFEEHIWIQRITRAHGDYFVDIRSPRIGLSFGYSIDRFELLGKHPNNPEKITREQFISEELNRIYNPET